ncbi:MAG TPA: hypothetical protein VKY19_09940 [Ktedonosporobacter sp.]|jgi:hypothetical protein|nr:hypothetical protein [Ktedonosporobacter sp.]
MPNRYEREIEEILRNLENAEPKPALRPKFGKRPRQKPGPGIPARHRPFFSFNFSMTEWLLVAGIVAALVSGGYAYLQDRQDIFTAILATVGIVCLTLVAFSHFLFRPRRSQSMRYGNVTVTPLRRSPFSGLKTQWNLFLLKLRYRRKKEH